MQNSTENKHPVVRGVGRPKKTLDSERRFRRDIANNHERKRMQSINDGILALRGILRHKDIDKLSKATVLLRSAEYLIHLETRLSFLIQENFRLKCLTKELIQKQLTTSLTVQQLVSTSQKNLNVRLTKQSIKVANDSGLTTSVSDQAIDLSLHPNGKAVHTSALQ